MVRIQWYKCSAGLTKTLRSIFLFLFGQNHKLKPDFMYTKNTGQLLVTARCNEKVISIELTCILAIHVLTL